MFQSIWDDIRYEYSKKGNYLMRVILINCAVFVLLSILWVIQFFSAIPLLSTCLDYVFSMPTLWTEVIVKPWTIVLTYFSHYQFFHILFNMLGLYWFGRIVEDLIGAKKFLAVYLLGGLTSSFLVLLMYNTIPYFATLHSSVIGASGAVFAVAVAAATLAPEYSLYLLLFGRVQIKYIVAIYIFLSIIGTTSTNIGGNLAHLGGAAFGFAFASLLRQGTDLGKPIYWILGLFDNRPKMKIVQKKVVRTPNEMPNQDEIDRILDKINRSGYESLSKEEKQKLFKASQNQ